MEQYEAIIQTIALTAGVAWASGINLYAVLLVLGLAGLTGNVDLPSSLEVLENPLVIAAAGLMYCVEFFTDKVPGIDTFWDTLHTFVRIPAGALLAAGSVGDMNAAIVVAAAILGGTMTATSHATKASARVLVNTSPEPFSNWAVSISEDLIVLGGLWAALHHPILFVIALGLFIALAIWLIPKMWRLIRTVISSVAEFIGLKKSEGNQGESVHLAPAERRLSQSELLVAIERLHKLKQSGAINEDEFQVQKQKLLAGA